MYTCVYERETKKELGEGERERGERRGEREREREEDFPLKQRVSVRGEAWCSFSSVYRSPTLFQALSLVLRI